MRLKQLAIAQIFHLMFDVFSRDVDFFFKLLFKHFMCSFINYDRDKDFFTLVSTLQAHNIGSL